jgi:hypothetical protein
MAEIAEQSAKDMAEIAKQTASALAAIKLASDLHDASTVKGLGGIGASAGKAAQ